MKQLWFVLTLVIFTGATVCGDESGGFESCVPQKTQPCACGDTQSGVQTCVPDGSGWKTDTGTSTLLMSGDGVSWTKVCDFPELAAWSIEQFNDRLYIGTWQYQSGGRLYEASPQ